MLKYIIVYFFIAALSSVHASHRRGGGGVPINFKDALSSFNHNSAHSLFDRQHFHVFDSKYLFGHGNFHSNISSECREKLESVFAGLGRREIWALQVADSFGKMPSGIYQDNLAWLGEFQECRNISVPFNSSFKFNYALLSKRLEMKDIVRPYSGISFKYGICAPKQCSEQDIYLFIDNMLPGNMSRLMKFTQDDVEIKEIKPLPWASVLTLCILATFVILGLAGTLIDCYMRNRYFELLAGFEYVRGDDDDVLETRLIDDPERIYRLRLAHESKWIRLMVNFSIYSNTKQIFSPSHHESDDIKCIHAIRVLSLAWIKLGHTYVFTIGLSDNFQIVFSWMKSFFGLIITNGYLAVDSFFVLSGCLVCYSFVRQIEKRNRKLTLGFMLKYYLHRFWRLTPVYVVAVLISVNLTPYMGIAPLYPSSGFDSDICTSEWWKNFLYINNFALTDSKICFGLSWYLANDMQFYWIAPLILIPFALGKIFIGLAISILVVLANCLAIVLTLYFNEGLEKAQFGADYDTFFSKYYILPWCRIGPYVIGILCAIMIIAHKKNPRGLSGSKDAMLWSIALLLLNISLFGLYPDAKGDHPLSRGMRIAYQTLSKLFWSFSISYIIYSTTVRRESLQAKILEWPIWKPLSKLSYSTFLVHAMVILYFSATQEHLVHLQHLTLIYNSIANLALSYLLGYLLCVLVEMPMSKLETLIFA